MIAMSNTPSVSSISPTRVDYPLADAGTPRIRPNTSESRGSIPFADHVEISDDALSLEAQGRDIRADLVARIRSEIASGTYLTEDKIDQAVGGLLEDLQG